MNFPSATSHFVNKRRPWIALACLFAFLTSSLGVLPSSEFLARWCNALHERFPCESCSCGCLSAHECWTSCCCHTLPERLAWAEREGVEVPRYVMIPPEVREAQAEAAKAAQPHCALCKVETSRSPRPLTSGLSALGCKGLSVWSLVSIPNFAGHPSPAWWLVQREVSFVREVIASQPESLALDITPPPPRPSTLAA